LAQSHDFEEVCRGSLLVAGCGSWTEKKVLQDGKNEKELLNHRLKRLRYADVGDMNLSEFRVPSSDDTDIGREKRVAAVEMGVRIRERSQLGSAFGRWNLVKADGRMLFAVT
jgi:hypothetical protein